MDNATILYNKQIASGIYEMRLCFDAGVEDFQPGQFAHVRLPQESLLLRRPISVNHVDIEKGTADIVYQLKGEGTRRMAELMSGRLDVLAPLGRGFQLPQGAQTAAVIGGGIGAAPLRTVLEGWPKVKFDTYLGFRSAELAYQTDAFERLSQRLFLCSDDGTIGERGFVTGLLAEQLKHTCYDVIFACGPTPMLRALQRVLDGSGVPCQVSLEERMGCGIGACLVCNCRVRVNDGGWQYRRVCADGPVFDIGEVDFHG